MNDTLMSAGVLMAIALAAYAALVWFSALYSKRTHWQPPDGTQHNDFAKRRTLGIGLGAVAVAVCGVTSALWVTDWTARLLIVAQAALLAASGASDISRFQLPLPLSAAGLVIAVVGMLVAQTSWLMLAFCGVWAIAVILMHTVVSKGSMQLGDHIATLWIALTSPANGLLAIAAGDAANIAFAGMKGLRGKKVAAAGAWLIFAAALNSLPPYPTWFAAPAHAEAKADEVAVAVTPSAEGEQVAVTTTPSPEVASAIADRAERQSQVELDAALVKIADWAGDHTASVALANTRDGRIAAAQEAAIRVAKLAAAAAQVAPGSEAAIALNDLAIALNKYDVEGVRDASQRLADERRRLGEVLATIWQADGEMDRTAEATASR